MGYLCYDYIHYATHHWLDEKFYWKIFKDLSFEVPPWGKGLRYGVSNPLWDLVLELTSPYSKRNKTRGKKESLILKK